LRSVLTGGIRRTLSAVHLGLIALSCVTGAQAAEALTEEEARDAIVWFTIGPNTAQGAFIAPDRLLTVLHALGPGIAWQGTRPDKICLRTHLDDGSACRNFRVTQVQPVADYVELTIESYLHDTWLSIASPAPGGRSLKWYHYDRLTSTSSGVSFAGSFDVLEGSKQWIEPVSGFDVVRIGTKRTEIVPFRNEIPGCFSFAGQDSPHLFPFKGARAVAGHSGSPVLDSDIRLAALVVFQVQDARHLAAVDVTGPTWDQSDIIDCMLRDGLGSYNAGFLGQTAASDLVSDRWDWEDDRCLEAADLHGRAVEAVESAWRTRFTPWVVSEAGFVAADDVRYEAPAGPGTSPAAFPQGQACPDLAPVHGPLATAIDAASDLLHHLVATEVLWEAVMAAIGAPPMCWQDGQNCRSPLETELFTCLPADQEAEVGLELAWRWVQWGPIVEDWAQAQCTGRGAGAVCAQVTCENLSAIDTAIFEDGSLTALVDGLSMSQQACADPVWAPFADGLIRQVCEQAHLGPLCEDLGCASLGPWQKLLGAPDAAETLGLLREACGYQGWVSPYDQLVIRSVCEDASIFQKETSDAAPLCRVHPVLRDLGIAGQAAVECGVDRGLPEPTVSDRELWQRLTGNAGPDETWAKLGTSATRLAALGHGAVATGLVDPVRGIARFVRIDEDTLAGYGAALRPGAWTRLTQAVEQLPEDQRPGVRRVLDKLYQELHAPSAPPRFEDLNELPDAPRDRVDLAIRKMVFHHTTAAAVFQAPGCPTDDCRRLEYARDHHARLVGAWHRAQAVMDKLHQVLLDLSEAP
jgi:hypothetical protein